MATSPVYAVSGKVYESLALHLADLVQAARVQARIVGEPLTVAVEPDGELSTYERTRLR